MDSLGKLLEIMERGGLIPKIPLAQDKITSVLDQRDEPLFAEEWMRVFHAIEAKKRSKQDAESRVTRLRELAFAQSFELWESPDVAAYVSDDFGLIGDALAVGYDDEWLNALFDAYQMARIPRGSLRRRRGPLGAPLLD